MVRRVYKEIKNRWNNLGLPKPKLPDITTYTDKIYKKLPIDFRNCEKFPDSVQCGGFKRGKFQTSLFTTFVNDGCNIGFEAYGIFRPRGIPTAKIYFYRNPDCNRPPPPPLISPPTSDDPIYADIPVDCSFGSSCVLLFAFHIYQTVDEQNSTSEIRTGAGEWECIASNNPCSFDYLELNSYYVSDGNSDIDISIRVRIINYWNRQTATFIGIGGVLYTFYVVHDCTKSGTEIVRVRLPRLLEIIDNKPIWKNKPWQLVPSATTCKVRYPQPILPPPPPPRMSCCPNVRENDELLRLIAKRLGAYDYPVSVPKVFTDRSKGTESIENLTIFHSWLAKQLDALCGKYPIEIEIKDSDLTKEGDQTKTIKIPNMAEGIGETLGMLLQIQSETSATLNAAIRTLVETASTKQTAIITYDYAKANAEFLGYKGEQEIRKTPFMSTPGKPKLDEVLKESEIEIKGWENVDEQDIKDLLAPLLEMAAMFRAQNFRNLGTQDTFGTLAKTLQNPQLISALSDFIKKEKKKDENQDPKEEKKKNENDFDKFIEEAENGFIAKEGIRDNTNPYGRPYEERPLIREIGTTTGE